MAFGADSVIPNETGSYLQTIISSAHGVCSGIKLLFSIKYPLNKLNTVPVFKTKVNAQSSKRATCDLNHFLYN